MTDAELDHRIILEVWDWDRLTANDFVGGLSMRVGEILDNTKEKPFTSWYKLLDDKRTKESHERILADDEAIKVSVLFLAFLCLETCVVDLDNSSNGEIFIPTLPLRREQEQG